MERNTRPLRAAKGKFHVGKTAYEGGLRLCDFCDRRDFDCKSPSEEGCTDLVPALFFVPPHIGLDGRFTTFRASAIWYDRARVLRQNGGVVALIDSTTGERVGRAKVVDAHQGPFWALMQKYAATNHLLRDLQLPADEAVRRLERWIANNMGSRFVKERDAIGTVLELERI